MRAPENTAMKGTRAAETYDSGLTKDPHTRTTKGTVQRFSRTPSTLEIILRYHARHRARRFRHLMVQTQPNSVFGLFNLKLLRAIRAGQQGNG